ncbi:SNF2 family N-terminal domain-domain-containing protein [Aspergillus welwitschiae]|uniref:SNF2 family N-terminal domain-domain-containing protein n=1 Tax=Aspergillus welwitschiae TaxID=1341132 RepID=A0A3F3PGT8_9EURO|nr:SNF2 family N-terminal domain-domain-containing protein [Aspergillus welwitschiae]RDH26131.1 SNF2 family N-terminal domain-domain-containing protein [Aspergillus welwitschiae]
MPRADAIGGCDVFDPLLFVGGGSDERDRLQMPGNDLQGARALEAGRPVSTVSTPSGEGNPPQWPSLLPGVACSLPLVPAANVTSVLTPGSAAPAAAFGAPGRVEAYAETPTVGQVSVPPLQQPETYHADLGDRCRTDASRDVANAAGTGPWLPSEAAPSRLTVHLMGHQEQGLRWMTQMEQSHRRGGILADEMGLGKTVQALALIVSRPPASPDRRSTLVVAPAGLVPQWKREIERLLPPDPLYPRVHVYYGPARRTRFDDLTRAGIVLTTFSTVMVEFRRQSPDSPLLGVSSNWHRVILDEAQSIKNDRSKVATACCALDATYRWCLSGTPVMNSPREFCSLLRFLRIHPNTALDASNTTRQPTSDTIGRRSRQVAMAQLQALAKEIMLRRTQLSTLGGQPIISLPVKHIRTVYVSFSSEEQRLYAALESRTRHHFRLCLHRRRVRSSDMLGLLQRLRQACCHPSLVPHVTDDTDRQLEANAQRFAEAVVARLQDNEHVQFCPICLTQVGNPLIFFPCGHSICPECFERVAADDRLQHQGSAQSDQMRCPTCRTLLDLSQITDYASFSQCHYIPPADSTEDHAGLTLAAGSRDGAHPTTSGDHTSEAAADLDLLAQFGLRHDGLLAQPQVARALPNPAPWLSLSARRRQASASQAARRQYQKDLEAHWTGSAKIDRALEIVRAVQGRGQNQKVVIFSQFTALLDLLSVPLARRGWAFERYDGSMNLAARDAALTTFARPDCGVLLVSLQAGNAGLNLTCASEVILLDPFWNPDRYMCIASSSSIPSRIGSWRCNAPSAN